MKFTKTLKRRQDMNEKRFDPDMYDYFIRMYWIVKQNNINQQAWDEMIAIWNDMKLNYPDYGWLHN